MKKTICLSIVMCIIKLNSINSQTVQNPVSGTKDYRITGGTGSNANPSYINIGGVNTGGIGGNLDIYSGGGYGTGGNITLNTAGQIFFLVPSGLIKIGTASGTIPLTINGTGNITTSGTISAGSFTTTGALLTSSLTTTGKVGIGTTTPLNDLNINKYIDANTVTTSALRLQSFSNYMTSHYNHALIVSQFENTRGISKLSFYSNQSSSSSTDPINLSNPVMELYSTGVDIDQPLNAMGGITTNGTISVGSLTTTGNVGIGTITPLNNLHINNFVNLNTTTTSAIRLQSFSPYMGAPHYSHALIVSQYDNSKFSKLSFYAGYSSSSTTDPINLNSPVMELYPNGVNIDQTLYAGGINCSGINSTGNLAGTNLIITNGTINAGANLVLQTNAITQMTILSSNGYVGIGTSNPTAPLTVKGKIIAGEVVVVDPGTIPADYVFGKNYNLKTLNEVEQFVNTKKHLPDVPSGKELAENGWNMVKMQNALLQKVEELTLYIIEQNKKNDTLQKKVEELENEMKTLKK